MSDDKTVDWDMLMQFGLGVLGLAPRDFWDMTPRELTAATSGHLGNATRSSRMDRTALTSLLERHPDETLSAGSNPHGE